jgi:Biotin-requiring enzyme
MMFFRQSEITIRFASRSTTLAVPDRDLLLDNCAEDERRRLQRYLARRSADTPSWSVQWRKFGGDALRAKEVVAVLRRDEVIVELAYAQRGVLAETFIPRGELVAAGTELARLERRARGLAPPPPKDLLRRYVARQRRDAETIRQLQAALAEQLSGRMPAPGTAAPYEHKFKRLKHEFSKRFHPDARPPGDAERERRELVFREFWPIFEEIERS